MEVRINGRAIPEELIAREMQYHPAPTLEAARREAVQALALKALLLDEARRQGLAAQIEGAASGDVGGDRDEALVERLLEREIEVPEPDEASCRRYFEHNRGRFRSPDLYEAAHVLIPASPDDPVARHEALTRAEELLAELRLAPERFADLARRHSACPSRESGGSLGQIRNGETVPEIDAWLDRLAPGTLADRPVESRYGFHLLRLDQRAEGRELPFEAVRERVAAYLREASWRRAVSQYLRLLAGRADVQGVDLRGADSPLVQ
jgi:peptidyl-prolyl cis-trans isomerase C